MSVAYGATAASGWRADDEKGLAAITEGMDIADSVYARRIDGLAWELCEESEARISEALALITARAPR